MPAAVVILDVGCGNSKRPGAVGIDFNARTQADVIHDLNVFPYPFADESFDEIYVDNTLAHLDDAVRVMEELYRICRPGGLVKVINPYFRSRWSHIDPTSKRFFTVESFAFYDASHTICTRYDYSLARFRVGKIVFNESLPNRWTKRSMIRFANRWPMRYEYYLSHFYPLDDITHYLYKV